MSLKIDQGLFSLDFTDYHAILGVPVDADLKDIRKRYLNVARRLHPDSCVTEDEADRQRAAEYLSKLVNPAYEKLSQERNYTEYCILLRLKGQQALKQQDTVVLIGEPARKLAAASDIDNAYRAALNDLATRQYQTLQQSIDLIGQISELNLVFLMRKESRGESGIPQLNKTPVTGAAGTATAASNGKPSAPATSAPVTTREDVIAAYLRRAQDYETKQNFQKAILELRDAMRIDPMNSQCQSRMGMLYLKTNQPKMAKFHFDKALQLNPKDELAIDGKRKLEGASVAAKPNAKPTAKAGKPPDPKAGKPAAQGGKPAPKGKPDSGGGLFGLFGGKKK